MTGWHLVVAATGVPSYILPGPGAVARAWAAHWGTITTHAAYTLAEILLGLGIGAAGGAATALGMASSRALRRWVLPALVVSQAVPVFALAPLLVLWFGYGMASKVLMATLIIYFPVTASFLDGLRRTNPGWIDLARTMDASSRAILWHVRVPAALPSLASGLRVAAAVAPIGAVIGEWVGSSTGLGYLMLRANGRMQIDLMFAALGTLALLGVALYFGVDRALRAMIPWAPGSRPTAVD